MNEKLWVGNNIPFENRVLILGESHYDADANKGEKVSFTTSEVVECYLHEKRKRWARFFDYVALTFGYSKETASDFYEKIIFGNYIDVVCGIGKNNTAAQYADKERLRLNNEWFDYINCNNIAAVVCFSKLAYNHFPGLNGMGENISVKIDFRGTVDYCNYQAHCFYMNCDIRLKKELWVYGINHPSARQKFCAERVYDFFRTQPCLNFLMPT